MSRRQPITYTTETGIGNPKAPVIEHTVARRARITDPTYGLSSGAQVVRTRIEAERKRMARLSEINTEVAKLNASLMRGTCSDRPKAVALREKLLEERGSLTQGTHWSTPVQVAR